MGLLKYHLRVVLFHLLELVNNVLDVYQKEEDAVEEKGRVAGADEVWLQCGRLMTVCTRLQRVKQRS